jgi:hypothetical protein
MVRKRFDLAFQAETTPISGAVDVFLECAGKFTINVIPSVAPDFHIDSEKYVKHPCACPCEPENPAAGQNVRLIEYLKPGIGNNVCSTGV